MPKIKVIRSARSTLSLSISQDATLVVKAPLFTPQFFIDSFIKKHHDWIQKHVDLVQSRQSGVKRYKDGEEFLYLGMKLEFTTGNYSQIAVRDGKLHFPNVLLFRAQKQLTMWYKKEAEKIITAQVEHYAKKMKTSINGLTFSDTKSKWGSCTPDNRLQFNWRLVMANILVINYVVVHELAHTIEKNHSRDFWDVVSRQIPTYRVHRNWLKKHGHTLVV